MKYHMLCLIELAKRLQILWGPKAIFGPQNRGSKHLIRDIIPNIFVRLLVSLTIHCLDTNKIVLFCKSHYIFMPLYNPYISSLNQLFLKFCIGTLKHENFTVVWAQGSLSKPSKTSKLSQHSPNLEIMSWTNFGA